MFVYLCTICNKSLLANVLKSTKSALVKLGTFSVASVHAKVCARHGGMLLSLHKKTSSFKASTDSPVVSKYYYVNVSRT